MIVGEVGKPPDNINSAIPKFQLRSNHRPMQLVGEDGNPPDTPTKAKPREVSSTIFTSPDSQVSIAQQSSTEVAEVKRCGKESHRSWAAVGEAKPKEVNSNNSTLNIPSDSSDSYASPLYLDYADKTKADLQKIINDHTKPRAERRRAMKELRELL